MEEQTDRDCLATHVLDTVSGWPAAGRGVELNRLFEGGHERIGEAITNANYRCDAPFLAGDAFRPERHELTLPCGPCVDAQGYDLREPKVRDEMVIRFGIAEIGHDHVPLLPSPFGYSTYRGS